MSSVSAAHAADDPAVAHGFVDALEDRVEIGGADGHHLQRVRRLRTGERVTLGDGSGAWRAYEVVESARGRLTLAAVGGIRCEPRRGPRIAVALALRKGGLEQVSARLTELGVERIEPVRTARSVVHLGGDRAAGTVARLRGVVREAAMQCRRATVPEVRAVADVAALASRADLVVVERGGAPAARLGPPATGTWTLLVGPEGGFAPEDLEGLRPCAHLGLGPHVLRAETAPVAAVAALLAREP